MSEQDQANAIRCAMARNRIRKLESQIKDWAPCPNASQRSLDSLRQEIAALHAGIEDMEGPPPPKARTARLRLVSAR